MQNEDDVVSLCCAVVYVCAHCRRAGTRLKSQRPGGTQVMEEKRREEREQTPSRVCAVAAAHLFKANKGLLLLLWVGITAV